MSRKQKIILSASIILLIIVGVVAAVARKNNGAASNQTAQSKQQAAENKTDAPAGQLVSGFPPELILNKDAQTNQSYTISYSLQNQYSAEIKTNDTVAQTYQAYLDYFSKNGYQVVNKSSQNNLASIYAQKNGNAVNVVASNFTFNGKQTDVEVTYLQGSSK